MTSQVHYEHYRHARLHPMKHLPLDDITSTPPSPIATPPVNCSHINPHSRRTSTASRRTSSNFSNNLEPIPLRTTSSTSSSGVSTPSKKANPAVIQKQKKIALEKLENSESPKKAEKSQAQVKINREN